MQSILRFRCHPVSLAISSAILLFLGSASLDRAQEIATNSFPEAPVPAIHSVHALIKNPSAPQEPAHHRWLTLNNLSIAVLFAGEAFDSWSTYSNLTHPRWICGYSPAFGTAVTYISDSGEHYDPQEIQNELCGPGPSGQLANYAYDVTRTGAYTETGWVTTLHLAGNRDFGGVLAWNLADDFGQMLAARYLSKKKGIIGKLAPGIDLSHGLVHVDCGVLNVQFARTHSNPNAWQFRLPNESSLYPTPRWWGRQ